jgi:tetratricopeptide (TPR) repeat protein
MALQYGKTAFDQGQYRESIDPLSAVLASDPKHVEAHKYRAMSLEGLEQYNAAISDYKKILEVEPENAETMCGIATDYKSMNQFSNAMFWTGRALKAKSGYGLAYITRAEIYEAGVSYCQDKENRGRDYDDGLVYKKAYNAYAQAAKDPAFKSDAKRRMSGLKGVLPTKEEEFMNQNRKTLKIECYTNWIK